MIQQQLPGLHRRLTGLVTVMALVSITAGCGSSYPTPRWVAHTVNDLHRDPTEPAAVLSDPTLAGGELFVHAGESLYAIATSNGRVRWRAHPLGGGRATRPVPDGDTVLVVGGQLFAFDAATGARRWTGSIPTEEESFGDPAVADGRIYIAEDEANHIYVLDATTGRLLSQLVIGSRPAFYQSTPVVTQGRIYVEAPMLQAVYALDAANGRVVWSGATPGGHLSDAVVAEGSVYVTNDDSSVYAFDAATGAPRWTARAGSSGEGVHTPAVAGGAVYFSTDDRHLYALSASTGTRLWTATLGDFVTSPATVAHGVVYVGDQDDKLYVLDAATGAVRGVARPGTIAAAPVVSGGMVYVGTVDGNVEAYDAPALENGLR